MNYHHPFGAEQARIAAMPVSVTITTGVPLSDRFRRLPAPTVNTHQTVGNAHLNYGLGIPGTVPHNLPMTNRTPINNKAFAVALAKRAQIQAIRQKRKSIAPLRGRVAHIPVTARLGTVRVRNQPAVISRGPATRSNRGGARGGGRGGLNFVQRNGGIIGKKIGGANRGNLRGGLKGRGAGRLQRGTGVSPLKKANANNRNPVKNKSKEDLDKELDSYMSKSKTRQRTNLDKELDEYMLAARAEAEAVATAAAAINVNESDVVMADA